MKNKYIKSMLRVAILLSVAQQSQAQTNPVKIFNTNGSTDESKWTIVTGKPTNLNAVNIVLQNGLIRITYPPRAGVHQ